MRMLTQTSTRTNADRKDRNERNDLDDLEGRNKPPKMRRLRSRRKLATKNEGLGSRPSFFILMFTLNNCVKLMPSLRSRIFSTRRDTVKPCVYRSGRMCSASYDGDTRSVEVTERDVVGDQPFTLVHLSFRTVQDDVTLVVRVIRQFSEERIEASADVVIRHLTELINQSRLRGRSNAARSSRSRLTLASRILASDCDRSGHISIGHFTRRANRDAWRTLSGLDRTGRDRPVVGQVR